MIQLITYKENTSIQVPDLVSSPLHSPQSLDEFAINIIDLSNEEFWRNEGASKKSVNCYKDLRSLHQMIMYCKKSKVVIILPQNCKYLYHWGYPSGSYKKTYLEKEELKNMIPEMIGIINNVLSLLSGNALVFENTRTKIEDKMIRASFYFNEGNIKTKSFGGEKPTTVEVDDYILTSLEIKTVEQLFKFINHIGLIKNKSDAPEWFVKLCYFDDLKQKEKIAANKNIIEAANSDILQSQNILEENNRYKSIVYTTGEELVNTVFDIIEEIFGVDLSTFVDAKNEDFSFEYGNKIYIGEIKGVNHNVHNENISQLDVHVQGYMDRHPDADESNIVALLIINHQKNKALEDREPVHERQILLAKRNGSLIVETVVLLELFSKYKNKEIEKEKIIELLNSTGLCALKW